MNDQLSKTRKSNERKSLYLKFIARSRNFAASVVKAEVILRKFLCDQWVETEQVAIRLLAYTSMESRYVRAYTKFGF